MATRRIIIMAIFAIAVAQPVLSGNLTRVSVVENNAEITDAELGGAITAAIVGFVALVAAVLILAYFLRSRCRTNRRRAMKTSFSASTFTYAKQYDDEFANSQTNTSLDPTVISLEDQRHASSPLKRLTANRGGSRIVGRSTPEADATSGFPTRCIRESKVDDTASVEPEVFVVDSDRRSGRNPDCHTLTSRDAFCYGYDDFNVWFPDSVGRNMLSSEAVGRVDPFRPRHQCANDDQHHQHRRSTTVSLAPRYLDRMSTVLPPDETGRRQRHRRRHQRSRTTSGEVVIDDASQSIGEHPIYARVGRVRRSQTTMTSDDVTRSASVSSENKSTTRHFSQRHRFDPDDRTVTVVVGDENVHLEPAPVRVGHFIGESSGNSPVVDAFRRETPIIPTVNTGSTSAAVTRSGAGSGIMSAEYCTRVVDEAFGSIVNPIFDVEMFV